MSDPRRVVPAGRSVRLDFSQSYVPTARQAEAHRRPERYVLFGGSMGGGKSMWLCAEGLQLSFDFAGNRGYLCRHENSVFRKTTLLTLLKLIPEAAIARHHMGDQYIEIVNGSRIYYGGLRPTQREKPTDRLKSMELGWFGIDEASETEEAYFLLLMTRLRLKLRGIRYRGLLTSNPEPGWVRRRFVESKDEHHSFVPSLPRDNPHLPPDYESNLRKLLPDDLVERYMNGNWDVIEAGANRVYPYALVREAMARELEPGRPVEFGVDVGGGGPEGDESVVVTRAGAVVEIPWARRRATTMELVAAVRDLDDGYHPTLIKVDCVGVGRGVVDRLREFPELAAKIREVSGGSAPQDPVRFANARSEDSWAVRDRLESGELALPDDDMLKAQMAGIKYSLQSDRKILIESKEKMRGRGLLSPDRLDAVVMSFSPGQDEGPLDVYVLNA